MPVTKLARSRPRADLQRADAFLVCPIELILVPIDLELSGGVPPKPLFFDSGPSCPAMARQTQKLPFLRRSAIFVQIKVSYNAYLITESVYTRQ